MLSHVFLQSLLLQSFSFIEAFLCVLNVFFLLLFNDFQILHLNLQVVDVSLQHAFELVVLGVEAVLERL